MTFALEQSLVYQKAVDLFGTFLTLWLRSRRLCSRGVAAEFSQERVMRLTDGSPKSVWISVTIGLLIHVAVVLQGAVLSIAQESSGQSRMSIGQEQLKYSNSNELVPSARNQNDQIQNQAKLEQIDLDQPGLNRIPEANPKHLLYTLLVVEVSADEAKAIIEIWNLVGASTSSEQKTSSRKLFNNAVGLTARTDSKTTSEFRISVGLSEQQISEIVELGKLIASPKIVAESGAEVTMRVGSDVQFVAAYEAVKDENGNEKMQPIFGTIHDGIKLDLLGALDDKGESVQYDFSLMNTQFKGMGSPFTYESKDGPLTVHQPEIRSSEIQTSCKAEANKTIAFCSGPTIRESVVEQGVPMIGRIPYVGKFFRYTSEASVSISTIVLIRCQEHTGLPPDLR